jgi:selenium metabolism protein YedF
MCCHSCAGRNPAPQPAKAGIFYVIPAQAGIQHSPRTPLIEGGIKEGSPLIEGHTIEQVGHADRKRRELKREVIPLPDQVRDKPYRKTISKRQVLSGISIRHSRASCLNYSCYRRGERSMKIYDCRGLACPKPVLVTKELIETHPDEIIEVIVDNEASRQNVSRFLKAQGWETTVREEENGTFVISGAPPTCALDFGAKETGQKGSDAMEGRQKILILIPTDVFGQGDDGLGRALMKNFISTLKEMGDDLWRIVLVNNGVRLAVAGSEYLEELKGLEDRGVDILVCGTCLNYFGLLEKKAVGETTNMLDIVTSIQLATKVIRV